jgi:predicted alpha/beta hydrolase family esterase
MSHNDEPVIERWVGELADAVSIPDENTYFVGHSIGCQAILRYVEKANIKVGGAVFVAGWFNLDNLETDEEKEVAAPWIDDPIDIEKLKILIPKSTLIISDNDPYGCLEENKEKFAELGSEVQVFHDAGHFTADDDFTTLPEALDAILKMAQ